MPTFRDLQAQLRAFSEERDWAQFHNPKNLAMALTGEVGELVELLQWLPAEEIPSWLMDPAHAQAVRHEIADVLAYLLQLADSVGVDPLDALAEKIQLNNAKYPVAEARGTAAKYNDLSARRDSFENGDEA